MLHLLLHFLVPLALALGFFRHTWKRSYLLMLIGLAIDIDHLLANPVYDANRCSIGFHPLHTVYPIALYGITLLHPKTRLIGVGLLVHIFLDAIDCQITGGVWYIDTHWPG